jgi:hypothetical protein
MTTSARSMAVGMPLWKPTLSVTENAFLTITDRSTADLERFWLVPEDLDVSVLAAQFPDWQVKRFPRECFQDVRRYSWWMTSQQPYRAFEDFEFMTICQTDAVLLKSPSSIDVANIDYIGAIWDPPLKALTLASRVYIASRDEGRHHGWFLARIVGHRKWVGNGGLSTRRIEAFLRASERLSQPRYANARRNVHEDALYAALAPRLSLRFASRRHCDAIYRERTIQGDASLPDIYGLHALEKWNIELCREVVESAC